MTTFPYVLLDVPAPLLDEGVERNDELFREVQLVGGGDLRGDSDMRSWQWQWQWRWHPRWQQRWQRRCW